MDDVKALDILLSYNYWGNLKESLKVRKRYTDLLEKAIKGNEIVVINGIRRAGKSSIIYLFLGHATRDDLKNGLVINLEDPLLPLELTSEDLHSMYTAYLKQVNPDGPSYVVLDEVQNVTGWERFARFLSETKKIKTIVTGSASSLMSAEYSTVLTGRHIDIYVMPLSFSEYLEFIGMELQNGIDILKKRYEIINTLNNYLKYGGFPAVVLSEAEDRKLLLLKSYFADILTKDIARRHSVKKIAQLDALARNYISNIATLQSFNKISSSMRLNLSTVERFSKYMEDAGLFFFLNNFSYSTTEQSRSIKKVYVTDPGFYTALGFKFMENAGKLIENAITVELQVRRALGRGIELFYCKRDYGEVDFVVKRGMVVDELIQATYASSKDDIKKRETRALLKASEDFKCENLLVITWDYEDSEEIGGKAIKYVPLWKWLTQHMVEAGKGGKRPA